MRAGTNRYEWRPGLRPGDGVCQLYHAMPVPQDLGGHGVQRYLGIGARELRNQCFTLLPLLLQPLLSIRLEPRLPRLLRCQPLLSRH
jgi:hypothetical protein